jgi:hypothetical protein
MAYEKREHWLSGCCNQSICNDLSILEKRGPLISLPFTLGHIYLCSIEWTRMKRQQQQQAQAHSKGRAKGALFLP